MPVDDTSYYQTCANCGLASEARFRGRVERERELCALSITAVEGSRSGCGGCGPYANSIVGRVGLGMRRGCAAEQSIQLGEKKGC